MKTKTFKNSILKTIRSEPGGFTIFSSVVTTMVIGAITIYSGGFYKLFSMKRDPNLDGMSGKELGYLVLFLVIVLAISLLVFGLISYCVVRSGEKKNSLESRPSQTKSSIESTSNIQREIPRINFITENNLETKPNITKPNILQEAPAGSRIIKKQNEESYYDDSQSTRSHHTHLVQNYTNSNQDYHTHSHPVHSHYAQNHHTQSHTHQNQNHHGQSNQNQSHHGHGNVVHHASGHSGHHEHHDYHHGPSTHSESHHHTEDHSAGYDHND